MRLRLELEYDGTPFRGWAAQPGLPTVEGTLRAALATTFASYDHLAVAGRTDTGVHALAQVASVDVVGGPPVERAAAALNTQLPDEISIVAAEEAAPDFHARPLLPGEHDFRAFTPSQTKHAVFLRNVERAEWVRRGDHLDFEITADSFLRRMVRSLVGTMLELEPEQIASLLDGGARSDAGPTAPPQGLYLVSVKY